MDDVAVPRGEASTTPEPATDGTKPLSKNAQKKLAKAAWIAEQKKERRAAEKERRKEKKRALALKRAAGELDEDEERRKRARTNGPRRPFHARIVVDLGFDDMMTDNEIKSLTSQLAYTYSANKKAAQPFAALLFTSVDGRTYTRLEELGNAAYRRWHETEWWQESYEKLWAGGDVVGPARTESETVHPEEEAHVRKDDATGDPIEVAPPEPAVVPHEAHPTKLLVSPQRAAQDSVVYLTADSEDELTELKEGETYIIGGICDHNRYKNLCFNKANTSKIRSARLPIGTYLAELRTRKVLTVNQTFEILLKWVETRDWRRALEEVVPQRKFRDPEEGNKHRSSSAAKQESGEANGTMVVDAAALEEDGEEDATDDELGDLPNAGVDDSTVVAAPADPGLPHDNGPATVLDDAHVEIPPST